MVFPPSIGLSAQICSDIKWYGYHHWEEKMWQEAKEIYGSALVMAHKALKKSVLKQLLYNVPDAMADTILPLP